MRYLLGVVAVAEILVVTLLGNVAGRGIFASLTASGAIDVEALNRSYAGAALATAVGLLARFGFMIPLALGVLWLSRRSSPRRAGLGTGGRSLGRLLAAGCLLFVVAALPQKLLFLVHAVYPVGRGLEGWSAYATQEWTGGYLLYVLAAQALLPPLLEEPLARGYMRERLRAPYGVAGSCLISAVIFMLGHGHFYRADPLVLSVLLTAVFACVAWAWVTWRTGSIVPAVVAHGLGNVPLPLTLPWLVPLVLGMALAIGWRRHVVGRELAAARAAWRAAPWPLVLWGVLLGGGALVPMVLLRPSPLVVAGVLLPLAAVGWLPTVRRRGERATTGEEDPLTLRSLGGPGR